MNAAKRIEELLFDTLRCSNQTARLPHLLLSRNGENAYQDWPDEPTATRIQLLPDLVSV